MTNSKENPALVYEPFTLTPTELTKLLDIITPYITRIQSLEQDLASAKSTLQNLLAAWLTGRGLEGRWDFNFQTGKVQPTAVPAGLATVADAQFNPPH